MNARNLLCCLSFLLVILPNISGQNRPGLFIDCQMYCDFSFIKQEITFVNYMLNRQDAEIFVLLTRQETGSGGSEVQMVFQGNGLYAARTDTFTYFVDPNATEALRREQMIRELKKGLLPFLLMSPLADQIAYQIDDQDEDETVEVEEKDPWDYWVFNIGGNGWFNGEASFERIDLTGRFAGSRITDQHKFTFNTWYNFEKSTFTLTDGEQFSSRIRRYNARALYVKSLTPRWSAGLRASAGSSTFGNTDLTASLKPAIEYNIFPYTEAQTKRFSFNYSIGPEYLNYTDSTIYDKMEETVMRHGLEIDFSQTQKWGSISLDMGVQQFLHNPKLFNAYVNPEIEWQIFKGFSVNMGGYFSFVRDRINIPKADITDEDILLQIKQLDTNFTYFTYFGINYRFGSSFNNFVNPRF